jgi:hypothetical protein
MNRPPVDPERISDDTAQQLLQRAAALDVDGPSLAQLRQAAAESGISTEAFDAAVAEWRAHSVARSVRSTPRTWTERALRNGAAFAVGWSAVAVFAIAQRLLAAPWLVHKLTDPIGLAFGAFVAARLKARTATIVLSGLAVSQGAELLMDFFAGAPAVRGFGAHMALMIAGITGVAIGRAFWGRRGGPDRGHDDPANTRSSPRDAAGDSQDSTAAKADAAGPLRLWRWFAQAVSPRAVAVHDIQPSRASVRS